MIDECVESMDEVEDDDYDFDIVEVGDVVYYVTDNIVVHGTVTGIDMIGDTKRVHIEKGDKGWQIDVKEDCIGNGGYKFILDEFGDKS